MEIDQREIKKVNAGISAYKEITEAKRMWVVGEPYYVDELRRILSSLSRRYPIGAVLIDYIQKVKIREKFGTRQVELQKISQELLETAKELSIPIIMGCQLGRDKEHRDKVRLDNLREAGDIEQDAHLVLGLFNPHMQREQDEGIRMDETEVELRISVLKQRNGPVNLDRKLIFKKPILTIDEPRQPMMR